MAGVADLTGPGATGDTTAFSTTIGTADVRVAQTLTVTTEDSKTHKGDLTGTLLNTFVQRY